MGGVTDPADTQDAPPDVAPLPVLLLVATVRGACMLVSVTPLCWTEDGRKEEAGAGRLVDAWPVDLHAGSTCESQTVMAMSMQSAHDIVTFVCT